MKRWALLICVLWAACAGAEDRAAVLGQAMAHWSLADGGKSSPHALTPQGKIELGVAEEGAGALPGAKAARLQDAHFDAGKALSVSGNAITVYLRARDPKGQWTYALFAKRGTHETINFNLFSVDLGGTPGGDIGFEVHSEQGFMMISFPVSEIDAKAWHDIAGRYDGRCLELICDGKVMAKRLWRGGKLTQNDEPMMIGGETDHGKLARPFTGDLAEAAVWNKALSDAELAAVMRKDSIVPDPNFVAPYVSTIHYRPEVGRLADTIPFFWKGEYHIFYLRAIDKVPWEHIVSTDLIHWKELPTALRSDGAADGPDGMHMFTGSVTEFNGTFNIFYTGWNPANKEGREKIMHATSPDLITWTKHPELGFFADGKHYENTDFRDPFLYWNEDEKCFWMFVCARDAKTKRAVQGVLKSKDIMKWEQNDPLILDPPLGDGTPECPDVFKIGDMYYLVHSPCVGTTDQRYAANLQGPYKVPETPSIDTPILYAAKRMFDGKRHIITGWIRDLGGDRDGGDMQWGGDQSVPREVYAGPNGQLLFRVVPEALAVFTKTVYQSKDAIEIKGGTPCAMDVPANYLLECTVTMDANAECSVDMRQGGEKKTGYRLTLNPEKREAAIAGEKFKYARTISLDAQKPIKIQAFVQGTIIECFINDAYAFSCRAYDFHTGGLALSVSKGSARVEQLSIKTHNETESKS